jgi:hypothetical protein
VPDRPASLLGATVWVPGQLPFALPDLGVVDGRVSVETTVTVAGDGSATWSSSVGATGAAIEYLRQLLAPLDDAGRGEAIGRLALQGRPDIERLNVATSGVKQVEQALRITVSGFDAKALTAVDYGLRGTIAGLVAPAEPPGDGDGHHHAAPGVADPGQHHRWVCVSARGDGGAPLQP